LVEMAADEVAEEREQMYADWVAALVPLSDKSYSLSALGEVKVEGKPAVGVRVSKKGQRDVNLYLDKGSGLVVKYEHVLKDVKAGGKEFNQECFFSDYKDFAGTKMPTRFVIKRDGALYIEGVCSDIRPEPKPDPSVFEKP